MNPRRIATALRELAGVGPPWGNRPCPAKNPDHNARPQKCDGSYAPNGLRTCSTFLCAGCKRGRPFCVGLDESELCDDCAAKAKQ